MSEHFLFRCFHAQIRDNIKFKLTSVLLVNNKAIMVVFRNAIMDQIMTVV